MSSSTTLMILRMNLCHKSRRNRRGWGIVLGLGPSGTTLSISGELILISFQIFQPTVIIIWLTLHWRIHLITSILRYWWLKQSKNYWNSFFNLKKKCFYLRKRIRKSLSDYLRIWKSTKYHKINQILKWNVWHTCTYDNSFHCLTCCFYL